MIRRLPLIPAFLAISLFSHAVSGQATKPKMTEDAKIARGFVLNILDEMEKILRENYYDPKFHGIDLKARIAAAKDRVKSLQYNWQMFRVAAQVLMEFDDSHTRFIAPPRTDRLFYGLGWQMVGDELFVTSVDKDTDAAVKGIEVGDQILKISKFTPNRLDLWKIQFTLLQMNPLNTIDLVVKKPDGEPAPITVKATTFTEKEYRDYLKRRNEKRKQRGEKEYEPFVCKEIHSSTVICKLKSFVVEKNDIDKMMSVALKYPKFILDLRGNGGGYVFIEEYLLSHFFEKEVMIGKIVTRDKTEERRSKVLASDRIYRGEMVVLIDSRSASAAEMTTRVLQIQKRAMVFGDYSSGSVMTSIRLPFVSTASSLNSFSIIQTGMSVTIADVIMSDGSRLEKTGVIPDQLLQPTGLAMKLRMDAVLSFAAAFFGNKLSPVDAGKLGFFLQFDDEPASVDPAASD